MRKWLVSVLLLFVFVSFGWAEPFQVLRGPIMAIPAEDRIVVNETTISLTPSTSIVDKRGRTLDFGDLRCGRWVSVEVEPDGESGMVATRIILLEHQAGRQDRDERLARLLIALAFLAAHRYPG